MRGLVRSKKPTLKDLAAVCLNIGHCGLPCEATIFCGLTNQFFLLSRFLIRVRFYDEFVLEPHLLMWGAAKHVMREQASVGAVMRQS